MFAVVLCTTIPDEAQEIARALLQDKLVACVNVSEVKSYFEWEGSMQEEKEALLIMKTKTQKVEGIIARIKELHSYEVPEIIALPIIEGYEGYLDWVGKSVT